MTDPYKFAIYKPSDGDARVKSGRREIYNFRGEEVLYGAFDTYLIDITWVPRMSWKNDTNLTLTYSYSCATRLMVIDRSEFNNRFSLGATYKGSSVTIDQQTRAFKPTETTDSRTVTIDLSVPPHSLIIFYQKRYKFRNEVFFILHTQKGQWNIGRRRAGASYNSNELEIVRKECEVEIMSEDYLTTQAPLSGTGIINVSTVNGVKGANATQPLDLCTEKCREKIWSMEV